MNYRYLLVIAAVAWLAACATQSTKPVDASNSAMLGLSEEPTRPVWEEWEASPSPSVPPEQLEPLSAFDYWRVDDAEFVESAWAPLSTLLDAARRQSEYEDVQSSATLMLEALEPGTNSGVVVDATFYVTSDREGVAVRLLRELDDGGSPSVVVLLDRDARGGLEPDRIRVLASPGFEEPSAFEITLARTEATWSAVVRPRSGASGTGSGSAVDEAGLYAGVLASQLWKPLTGNGYASATLRAESTETLPTPFRKALGLEVGDRDIERVFTNSVFTPRMDDFSPGG